MGTPVPSTIRADLRKENGVWEMDSGRGYDWIEGNQSFQKAAEYQCKSVTTGYKVGFKTTCRTSDKRYRTLTRTFVPTGPAGCISDTQLKWAINSGDPYFPLTEQYAVGEFDPLAAPTTAGSAFAPFTGFILETLTDEQLFSDCFAAWAAALAADAWVDCATMGGPITAGTFEFGGTDPIAWFRQTFRSRYRFQIPSGMHLVERLEFPIEIKSLPYPSGGSATLVSTNPQTWDGVYPGGYDQTDNPTYWPTWPVSAWVDWGYPAGWLGDEIYFMASVPRNKNVWRPGDY